MLVTGLNPYGLTYTLGLQGRGTPRANPAPEGLPAFLAVAQRIGARSIELHAPWLFELSADAMAALRGRLGDLALEPVVSLGPPLERADEALAAAEALGAKVLRLGLTPVLCGDRAAHGAQWDGMLRHARATLRALAPAASGAGVSLAIEDHQDLGSQELIDLAAEAGEAAGITLDTGNPLAVAEDILGFTRRVAPLVRHVHLKDYRVQWTREGYRLVRCAIGDGCVPFLEIVDALRPFHRKLTASLEPAALEARHVRLFRADWWQGYPPRGAADLGACLADARRATIPDDADSRTPWEREAPPHEIVAYERHMMERSAANMRALGLMENQGG